MKKILRPKLLVIPVLLVCISLSAQVKTNFNNKATIDESGVFLKPYKAKIDFQIAAKNITVLLEAESEKSDTTKRFQPFQFAVPVPVDLEIAKLMQWNYSNDSAYGKFTIKVNGALSSSINFDKFYLPKGTELYVYNENGSMITGPITEKENNPKKIWGSWVYKGQLLIIEIKTPLSTLSQLELHANNISYGYKEIYEPQVGGFGQSATCEINVVCPLGNGWQNERNSVALILNGNNTVLFSGALIMNTCNTNMPYLLTANHCYQDSPDVGSWKFTFQAWSPVCTPSQNANGTTFNGSTLKANSNGSDFCLVELNQTPPVNSGINYSGWSRNTNGITQTTIIHHPMGDVMKITRDNNAPVFGNFGGANCWHLIVDNGTTEPGSSGSPYFDQNHRIIAQHYGIDDGNLPICNQVSKYGGRFDISWTGGGTNATRLSNWLDPSNSGAMTTNTTNVSALVTYPYMSISGADLFCSGTQTYTLNGAPGGATVFWSATPSNIATLTPNGTTVDVTKAGGGAFTLSASVYVANCYPATKIVHLGPYGSDDYPISGPSNANCNSYVTYTTNQLPGATSYNWFYPSSWTYVSGQGTYSLTLRATGSNGNYQVGVRVDNTCGTAGSPAMINTNVNGCSGYYYTVSPNPATSTVTATVSENNAINNSIDATKSSTPSTISEINIYDQTGNLKKHQLFNKLKRASLDISNLPTGIYVIEISDGSYKETQKLQILKN